MKLGELYKTYVVECANRCGSVAIFNPVKIDGIAYSYKSVVIDWLLLQGWKETDGLWTCLNCAIEEAKNHNG